jgi:predicted aspartyl protease
MEKVRVSARIENLHDLYLADRGQLLPENVRRLDVPDALVDTEGSTLSLPHRLVTQLGLKPLRTRQERTSAGLTTTQVYGTVRLTIQGRDCSCDVVELPDECPAAIGIIALGLLDFVVDPNGQGLIGNPAHGGEHIIELY